MSNNGGRRASKPLKKERTSPFDSIPAMDSKEARIELLNQAESPLLRLPGEIRNLIYDYAMDSCWVHIRHVPRGSSLPQSDCWKWSRSNCFKRVRRGEYCYSLFADPRDSLQSGSVMPVVTQVALICRQTYQEAALLPYERNVWSFENGRVFKRFM